MHNKLCTCWNCPAINLAGKVDFRACGQSAKDLKEKMGLQDSFQIMAECKRRPELGLYDPMSITFEECPEWRESPFGYLLKDMRVMILGIDGYLGWTLALWLGNRGLQVSGVDNYNRRIWVKERGAHTVVPISRMSERLQAAKEVLNIDINFREIDIANERERLKEFIDEVKPEAIIHYAECPSAPFSMIDADHAIYVQKNNVLGTLGLLFIMRDIVPESSLLKLGTMGEYGTPLTGRPLFEGMFPSDAILKWGDREWSLGGELTPRDPPSFYHASKVQDTFNIAEACKYWWLRSHDIMQGVIYGVHTDQVAADPRLRTRFDIDEWFGTVINRLVAQAIIGIPLTLYGTGEQIRGFIALEDAMQCMTRLIAHPPEPGQYAVANQISGYYSLRELAITIAKIGKEEFNLPVKIQRIENPRVESERHPFEPIFENLPKRFGFVPCVRLEEEVYRTYKLLIQPEIRRRIEEKKHHIIPKTWWSGEKRRVETLEIFEIEEEINRSNERLEHSRR
ncbi:MAG: NAD-dependent epimerase/dehydratase family protein [Candidatus Aminicenantes bacterium]|nr:NAD-dependent epimerase/dehydratase family protein [Candidatus Aminicenantes bacterium]